MDDLCMFDNNPATDAGMCEYCWSETEYMTTCIVCNTSEHTRVIQGRVNAYYECVECGDNWM